MFPLTSWPVLGSGVEDRSKTYSPLSDRLDWGWHSPPEPLKDMAKQV